LTIQEFTMHLIQHDLARAHIDRKITDSMQRARERNLRRALRTSRRDTTDRLARHGRTW